VLITAGGKEKKEENNNHQLACRFILLAPRPFKTCSSRITLADNETIALQQMPSNNATSPLTWLHKLGLLTWGSGDGLDNQDWLSTTTMASQKPHSKHIQESFISKVTTIAHLPQEASTEVYPHYIVNVDMERNAMRPI
jgi:hypothetical protein